MEAMLQEVLQSFTNIKYQRWLPDKRNYWKTPKKLCHHKILKKFGSLASCGFAVRYVNFLISLNKLMEEYPRLFYFE